MWCLYYFMFFAVLSGICSQNDGNSENQCIVPPKDAIKNGKFKMLGFGDQPPPAGRKLYSYTMKVTCDPGFTRQGLDLVACGTNDYVDDFPKCIGPCQRKSSEVLSCGIGFDNEELQCLLSSKPKETLTTRIRTDLQCGVLPAIFRTSVVNGTEAKLEDTPWHATIYTKTTAPYMQICGGTIVSTNVVISAAHCFWDNFQKKLPAENFAVAVGKIYRPWNDPNDTDAQKFEIKGIRIPPRFQGSTTNFQDDIAILILKTEIKLGRLIVPACLDFDYDFNDMQLKSGRKGRVSGFGLTSADGAASQVLIWAELPVVDIEQCIATAEPGFTKSITSDKICAGFSNGTTVCRGDSGGGLLIPEDVKGSKRYFLRGVVSTAPPNDHHCNVYSVATFTHIVSHERFIRNAMKENTAPDFEMTTQNAPELVEEPTSEANRQDNNDPSTPTTPETNKGISIIERNVPDAGYDPPVFNVYTKNNITILRKRYNQTDIAALLKEIRNNNNGVDTVSQQHGLSSAPITNAPPTINDEEAISSTRKLNLEEQIGERNQEALNPELNNREIYRGIIDQNQQRIKKDHDIGNNNNQNVAENQNTNRAELNKEGGGDGNPIRGLLGILGEFNQRVPINGVLNQGLNQAVPFQGSINFIYIEKYINNN